jgi:methionyl-tRNA formyltransferase
MRIAIIGRTELLYDTALRLHEEGHQVVCILTAKEAPEYTRTAADFRDLAGTWQIPFAQGGRISSQTNFLRNAQADIAVSINYTGVVPQPVIDLFPLGVLNAHGGDLPRYRGNACQAWAILNGEKRIGLCIHRMIGGELDSGDILAREYLLIDHCTTVTQVWQWMLAQTPALMCETLARLAADPSFVLERQSQNPRNALRCYPRRPEDGRINWQLPALDVLRLINASTRPYAGAFCNYEGQPMIIWHAELIDDGELFCAVPGQVTKVGESSIEVACGVGKIRIHEVQVEERCGLPHEWIQSIRKRLT